MMLAILEEEGCTDTRAGHINRVARYIAANYVGDVSDTEFEEVCVACNVDGSKFTLEDIEKIQELINKIGV